MTYPQKSCREGADTSVAWANHTVGDFGAGFISFFMVIPREYHVIMSPQQQQEYYITTGICKRLVKERRREEKRGRE